MRKNSFLARITLIYDTDYTDLFIAVISDYTDLFKETLLSRFKQQTHRDCTMLSYLKSASVSVIVA